MLQKLFAYLHTFYRDGSLRPENPTVLILLRNTTSPPGAIPLFLSFQCSLVNLALNFLLFFLPSPFLGSRPQKHVVYSSLLITAIYCRNTLKKEKFGWAF